MLVRVHSECITSEVFGSLKCDCKEQLDAAMAAIARRGAGVDALPAARGARHRPRQQDPRLRAAVARARHRRRQSPPRAAGRRAHVRRRPRHARAAGRGERPPHDEQPGEGARAPRARGGGGGRVPLVVAANPLSAGYLEAKRLRMAHDPAERYEPAKCGRAQQTATPSRASRVSLGRMRIALTYNLRLTDSEEEAEFDSPETIDMHRAGARARRAPGRARRGDGARVAARRAPRGVRAGHHLQSGRGAARARRGARSTPRSSRSSASRRPGATRTRSA